MSIDCERRRERGERERGGRGVYEEAKESDDKDNDRFQINSEHF